MQKFIVFIVLVLFLTTHASAGENRDKRKRKQEEQREKYRQEQELVLQNRNRDLNAEDQLYKEIQDQERSLSKLRRKLYFLHEDNTRKYGQQRMSQDQIDYIRKCQDDHDRDRRDDQDHRY